MEKPRPLLSRFVLPWAFLALAVQSPLFSASLVWTSDLELPFDTAGRPIVRWSNGRVLVVESDGTANPVIRAFDAQGKQTIAVGLTLPGSPLLKIYDRASSPNGRTAVCGISVSNDGRRAPFLAQFSEDGTDVKITATGPYWPQLITFASDGTIWTIGLILVRGKEDPSLNGAYHVARHFDSSGKEIGSALPRTAVTHALQFMEGWLAFSSGAVGWYSGQGPSGAEYFEFSDSGAFEKYPGVPVSTLERPQGFARLNNNTSYLTVPSRELNMVLLYRLDRQARNWVQVPVPSPAGSNRKAGFLVGGDGDRLVFNPRMNRTLSFYRVVE